MEKVASGRIAVWEGGSLWVFDVPGEADGLSRRNMHSHHAFQLTFALSGTFNVRLADQTLPGPFVVVEPDRLHAFEAKGLIAHLFVEPESRAGRSLRQHSQADADISQTLGNISTAADLIRAAFNHPVDPKCALREVGIGLCNRIAGISRTVQPDRRVRQIIHWANENLDASPRMSAAASLISLSRSRASHLFVEETGLPFRHYVLWLRLIRAVETYAAGASLTESAHEAGFSDSAHLSRTFIRMFGLPAASADWIDAQNSWMPVSFDAMARWMLEEAVADRFVRAAPLVSRSRR